MIRVQTIHIEEFRGIRSLDLDLDAKNFGICGPNGTGKSGVVDAVEFCITGDITRLSGQGSSGLSVKAHAPHVVGQPKPVFRKVTALADLSALQSAIKEGEPSDLAKHRETAKSLLQQLKDDEKALTLARQQGLIRTGLDLVTEDACPLCDTKWKAEELREYLRKKLLSAEEIEKLVSELGQKINGVLAPLSERIQAIERTVEYCQKLDPALDHADLLANLEALKNIETALTGFMEDHSKVEPALDAVSKSWWSPETTQQARIDKCEEAVKALPDTSAEDEAREVLTVAQDRYERLLSAAKASKERAARSDTAQKILDHYNDSCAKVLEGIYDQVAKDFSEYYRIINRDDEEKFIGKLKSAPAKLSFNVDFYGRGLFPPGAYHSEGHQDAMGLCLYLALMKHTLGDKFKFAVLDDVLMSVDTGHRREVCRMLKSEFPNTQFILTTHDRVWLQYMKTEGLIAKSQSFSGWTVDSGPRVWDDHDIWTEIESALDKDDVAKAAWLLRRYLEYTATILADNLRARVEFRGDGHYDLGDLLPHVLKEWKKKLADGEKSAAHWDRKEEKEALTAKRAEAKKLIAKTNAEQWVINPSVHYSEWANFERHEFQEVVNAFKELLENLRCENESCKSYLYVSPPKGSAEEMRCNCGATNINLKTSG